ncbi:MAG: gliding motility-associated C-terminal domain-containing protein, partial [Endomicrobia bacterium]|nr:gliding motility-associated C-terminal domain-containing protein [Endomicrobiia bacterium]
ELYYSTRISTLFGSTPPSLTGAYVGIIANLSSSYAEFPSSSFIDNTTYYWRLKVIDYEGAHSWSIDNPNISKFVVNHTPQPPSSCTLVSPVFGTKINSESGVFFDWNDAIDADPNDYIKYFLYISSISSNTGFVQVMGDITWSSYTLNSIFGGDWVENKKYYWYIKVQDSFLLDSYSNTGYFTINNIEEPPQANFLLFPGTTVYTKLLIENKNHIISDLHPTFYWSISSDLDLETTLYYQLLISTFSNSPTELDSIFYTTQLIYNTYYFLQENILTDKTTYFWRVRIWDIPYSGYAVYSSTTFWFYTYTSNTPPTPAMLVFPYNNFTTSYFFIKFEWIPGKDVGFNAAITSQTFVLWNNFEEIKIENLQPSITFYFYQQPLRNNTTYYWKIITYDNAYPSNYLTSTSTVNIFFIKNSSPLAFSLLSPQIGQILNISNLQVFWETSVDLDNDPTSYQIIYSTNNFLTYISSSGLKNTNYIINNLQDNTTYWWYVYAFDIWGNKIGCFTTFYFVVDNLDSSPFSFKILYPEDNALFSTPSTTFYWQNTYDIDPFETINYKLVISTDYAITSIYFSTTTSYTVFYLPKGLLNINATYYWTVIAVSSRSGQTLAENGPFKFNIYNVAPFKPILLSPLDQQVIKTSTTFLIWSKSVDFEMDDFYYEIYISTNGEIFKKNILNSQHNSLNLSLVDDTTYYWYVVVVDTYSNTEKTEISMFYSCYSNTAPTKPIILQPQDNQSVSLPFNISWTECYDYDIFDNVKYRVEISTNSSFNTFILQTSVPITAYSFENLDIKMGTYYMRIVAYDTLNTESYSDIISFIIISYDIQLFKPQDLKLINNLPILFEFSKIDPIVINDTITYKIIISSYSNFIVRQDILTISTYYAINTVPMLPATYYWYVEAFDSYDRKAQSAVYRFIVPDSSPDGVSLIYITTTTLGVEISWQKIQIESLWGYRVYRGFNSNKIDYLLSFTTTTSFVDVSGLEGNFYYTVKTVNIFGVESKNYVVVQVLEGQQVDTYISEDGKVLVSVSRHENISYLDIEKLSDQENEFYPYVYEIISDKVKTETYVKIQFLKPSTTGYYTVQYFDGYLWQNLPYKEAQNIIALDTQYLGRYRLVYWQFPQESSLTILGCSPKKRILTLNNDGKNDYIEFHYETGKYIYGEIYDIYFRKVCDIKNKDVNILYFDGRNQEGKLLPAGVYFYNIKSNVDKKEFSGTIILKY